MSVVVVGANHRTAPLELLERMAVTGDRLPKLLHALDGADDVAEVVVLATCNRTEVYVVAERFHSAYSQVRDFFSDLTFLTPDRFSECLYVEHDDRAVQHLFEVAAGLDSAVPGEHEILGQVRTAWDIARAEGTSRRSLNLLFRHALEVGKRARSETRISHHVTSVSQAAVIMAGERLGATGVSGGAGGHGGSVVEPNCAGARAAIGLAGRRAVVVGAGSMARGMARFLADAHLEELVIANRTEPRAVALAESLADSATGRPGAISGVGLDRIDEVLAKVDVVFTATDSTEAVVSAAQLSAAVAGPSRSVLVVDVGMPRDVEPAAADVEGVDLLDMAAVAELTEASLTARRAEADAVREIVEHEIARFDSVVSAREVAPVVTALRDQAEGVRRAELERFAARLETLSPEQRDAVEALTRGMLAKLLHTPTVQLKDSAGSSRGERLADSIRDLFELG
ncbi:MAG: glutamyl-tRNA reductase [Microthrixaceae bacterium]